MKKLVLFLAAGFAFACASSSKPVKDAPPEKAAAGDSLKTEEVSYAVGDTKLTGFIAWDPTKEGRRPGVLVVHEWWGHNEYVRKRARMLAGMGYTAFAIDMYGDGKKADHPKDAKKFMMEVMENMDAGVARFEAARKILTDHETTDPDKTAAIGYCFGGAVVLHMARNGAPLVGVASFHGNLSTKKPAAPGAMRSAILVAHGEADPFVPPEQVAAFKDEMQKAGARMKFVSYPGVKHSFTNPDATAMGQKFEMPVAYDEDADQKSWQELETFFGEIFAD